MSQSPSKSVSISSARGLFESSHMPCARIFYLAFELDTIQFHAATAITCRLQFRRDMSAHIPLLKNHGTEWTLEATIISIEKRSVYVDFILRSTHDATFSREYIVFAYLFCMILEIRMTLDLSRLLSLTKMVFILIKLYSSLRELRRYWI